MKIVYTSIFFRKFNKLPKVLQDDVREKITLFAENPRNPSLRAHKLKGQLRGYFSFSVNYKYRIVYEYDDAHTVALLTVGDHSVYE